MRFSKYGTKGSSFLALASRFCGGGLTGPAKMARIVLRSCPVIRAMSLIVTPLRCKSLIMNRSSTFSIGGSPFGTPANRTIMPQVEPLDQRGDFYLALFGDS